MKKILIVEDDGILKILEKRLKENLEVITAISIVEAKEKFNGNPDLEAIVLDGYVFTGYNAVSSNTTLDLITEFRETFRGPMIAMSPIPKLRDQQMVHGCDYGCEKRHLIDVLGKLLNMDFIRSRAC